jgi:ribosomal-protein-alanine N-acetyltransferase
VAEAEAFLTELDRMQADGVALHWGITQKPDDRVLGSVSLTGIDRYHRRAGIGYDLAREHWGRGIAREAVRAVLDFGFGTLGLHRIDAQTIADNHESVRLLRALGFTQEAALREFSLEDDGVFHDSTIWSLLDREFALQPRA